MKTGNASVVMTDYSTLNAVRSAFGARPEDIHGYTPEQRAAVLQLSEMIVVDERISLDDYLISKEPDAARVADGLKGIVIPIRIDDHVRVTAAVQAIEFGATYPELEIHLPNLRRVLNPGDLDPEILWSITREFDRQNISVEVRRRAEKLLSVSVSGWVPRTVYYYFLARLLDYSYAPFASRTETYNYLLEFEAATLQGTSGAGDRALSTGAVARRVLAAVEEKGDLFRKEQGMLGEFSKPLDLPSVMRLVMERARQKRSSIIEASVEIRDSIEAKSFRSFVAEYHQAIVERNAAEVNKIRFELHRICDYWASAPGITGMDNAKFRISTPFLSAEAMMKSRIIKLPKALQRNKHLIFLHEIWKAATL